MGEATMQLMEKMVDEVNTHRLKADCFGESNKIKYDQAIEGAIEKCMQLAPAFNLANIIAESHDSLKEPFRQLQFSNLENLVSLWRTKRDTGLVNVDEDDFVEFLDDVSDFKGDMASKMGNLTCVLTEMKLLTPDMKINIKEFPQTTLDRNPMKKRFGRQMMFFHCADKNEKMNCALGQMNRWLESYYATDDRDLTEFGLPADKYEASGLTLMVKYNGASDEEKFLSNFFWGGKW